MHGRDSSQKASKDGQYKAVGGGSLRGQDEHMRRGEERRGEKGRMGEGTATTAESHSQNNTNSRERADRDMLQVLEVETLGARMPRHAGMLQMQGSRTSPMGMPERTREGWRYKDPKRREAKSGGRLDTGSK